jgi:hypothetical protein
MPSSPCPRSGGALIKLYDQLSWRNTIEGLLVAEPGRSNEHSRLPSWKGHGISPAESDPKQPFNCVVLD